MTVGILLVWPFLAGFAGAWFARSSYDLLGVYLRRTPRWRRFDRAMARLFRVRV